MPRKNNSPAKATPSELISNQILNGDTSQGGVGLPVSDDCNISQVIIDSAASSTSMPRALGSSSKTSSSRVDAQNRDSLSKASSSSPRRKSPKKGRSPMRMQFGDSDSDDEGAGFSALKAFYPALNAVEQCSLLQHYSRENF